MIDLKKYNNELRIYRTAHSKKLDIVNISNITLTRYWIYERSGRWDFWRKGSILTLFFLDLKD